MLFAHFYLIWKKNRNLACISSKQVIRWNKTHNFSFNKLKKKAPFGKMNCWIYFFTGAAIKITVFWHTKPVSCASNDLQLEIQKRCCYLKNVALYFVLLVLKLYSIQVVIALPLWIKLTMDQLLFFFCATSSAFLVTSEVCL